MQVCRYVFMRVCMYTLLSFGNLLLRGFCYHVMPFARKNASVIYFAY